MRRLTLLTGALIIALWAARLLTGGQEPAPYLLRDGLFLAVAAAMLFAAQSSPPRRLVPRGIVYHWPSIGRALWGAGIASVLVSTVLTSALLTLSVDAGGFSGGLRSGLWLVGLALIGVGALWRGRVQSYAAPAYRWQRTTGSDEDAAGAQMMRVPVSDAPAPTPDRPGHLSDFGRGFGMAVGVAAMLAVGALLRLWQLGSAPAACAGRECVDALQLSQAGQPLWFAPFFAVAQATLPFTENAVLSLRLSAAVFGIATLLFVFLALKRLVTVESALIGAWLLALSPWHIGAGRTAQPGIAVAFFITLSLWALLHALASRDRRWWVAAGITLGAVAVAEPGLALAVGLWAVAIAVVVAVQRRRLYAPALLLVATAITVSLTPIFQQADGLAIFQTQMQVQISSRSLVDAWLNSVNLPGDLVVANWLTLALAMLGLGHMLRFALRPAMSTLLAGAVLTALSLFLHIEPATLSPSVSLSALFLPLLPFGIIAATLAADQLLTITVDLWRSLVRPAYLVTAALLLVILVGGVGISALWDGLNQGGSATNDTADAAMLAYLETAVEGGTVIYVPPSLFENPAFQLQGIEWVEKGSVQPLSSIEKALFAGGDSTVQRFLIRGGDQSLLDLLRAYFPNSSAEPHFDEEVGQLLFYTVTAAAADRLWPGLVGSYFSDTLEPELLMDRRDGPLIFDWTQSFSPQPPFVVEWQGSLHVPEGGTYRFAVDGVDDGDNNAETVFTLLLDNRVMLDSSLGMIANEELLAEGIYRIDMRYKSGPAPAPLSLRWTRPDGIDEVIPRTSLVTRPLPDLGLTGAYFAGAAFQPPAIMLRKDQRFDQPPPTLPDDYSVRWTGMLAANRAGEYLLATLGNGYTRLLVDDRLVIENRPLSGASEGEGELGYAEGLIYLEEGWHDIQIDFAAASGASPLQVLWQAPGSFPGALSSIFLRPLSAELEPADLAMPPAPPLTDSRLGSDDFALSQGSALRQAAIILPPQDLPPLALEQIWQVGGSCGSDEDQLNGPHGVVIDAPTSRIYVADSGNRRVAVYDLDGSRLESIVNDAFEEPHDVDVDQDGYLIVLDSVGAPLHRVDTETGEMASISMDTSFYRPRGLSVSSRGELLVTDTGGGRIVLLTPDGETLAIYGGADSVIGWGQPVDAIATERSLWSITAEDGRLWDLNTEGSMSAIERTSTLDGPQLADLDDGTFFLSDPARRTIFYHRADGRPMAQFAYAGVLERPTGVDAVIIDDQIYVVIVDTDQCVVSLWKALF